MHWAVTLVLSMVTTHRSNRLPFANRTTLRVPLSYLNVKWLTGVQFSSSRALSIARTRSSSEAIDLRIPRQRRCNNAMAVSLIFARTCSIAFSHRNRFECHLTTMRYFDHQHLGLALAGTRGKDACRPVLVLPGKTREEARAQSRKEKQQCRAWQPTQ